MKPLPLPAETAVEQSIARHWPDIERIARETGAGRKQIEAVMARLDGLEDREHSAALTDLEAYRDSMPEPKDVLLVAHAAYVKARDHGEIPAAWMLEGECAYSKRRQAARRDAAS